MNRQALFTLDLNLCTGCSACAIACRTENAVAENLDWRQIYTFNESHLPSAAVFHFSLACNHCRDPACMHGCPANAYTKDEHTGAVLLDADRCIGCGYCAWVCPYDAPQYNADSGVMEKCTFCSHRIERGDDPACVVACPVAALGFDPAGTPGPAVHPGLPETGISPGIRITAKRARARAPAMTAAAAAPALPRPAAIRGGLRSEWSLLVFSYLAGCLVAWFAAGRAGDVPLSPGLFFASGAIAAGVSLLHLGRPDRAWRAIANLRRSWVSREIFFFSIFFGSAVALLDWWPQSRIADGAVLAFGFTALFSIDMAYRVPGQRLPAFPHSSMTMLTATLFIGLLARDPWLAAPVATLKLALYLSRVTRGDAAPWPVALIRIASGFLWPLTLWSEPVGPLLLVAGPLLGEFVDRAEFYATLEFLNPRRQIDLDLRRMAQRSS